MIARTQMNTSLILLSILLVGAAGCAPQSAQPMSTPTMLSTPTAMVNLPEDWETYTHQAQCGFVISDPIDMDISSQGTNSWTWSITTTGPSGPVPNFIYISVIPDDFQGGAGEIYNYDPAATEILLNMQVGESKSVHGDTNLPGFTYTRLPDTTLSNQTAQTYENTEPWEFPLGTKEIRYYLKANGCTYLVGGYMATVGSGQPGGIDEALFNQIIATFQVLPS
jgi:hypothetical protein